MFVFDWRILKCKGSDGNIHVINMSKASARGFSYHDAFVHVWTVRPIPRPTAYVETFCSHVLVHYRKIILQYRSKTSNWLARYTCETDLILASNETKLIWNDVVSIPVQFGKFAWLTNTDSVVIAVYAICLVGLLLRNPGIRSWWLCISKEIYEATLHILCECLPSERLYSAWCSL